MGLGKCIEKIVEALLEKTHKKLPYARASARLELLHLRRGSANHWKNLPHMACSSL